MKNLIFKVSGYIFLRNAIFHLTLPFFMKNVKSLKGEYLRNYEDWFMFSWLFILPAVIEILIFAFPFSYGLKKIDTSTNKLKYHLLFIGMFSVEYIALRSLNALTYLPYKITVSIFIFIIMFRRQIF